MGDDLLLVEEDAGIVTLRLNRPEVMNSLNFPLLYALRDQIESFRFRTDIRVVIITGSGAKAFCAGADLKERATFGPDPVLLTTTWNVVAFPALAFPDKRPSGPEMPKVYCPATSADKLRFACSSPALA